MPLMPTNIKVNGSFFLRFSSAILSRSIFLLVSMTSKRTCLRFSSTTFLRSSRRLTWTPTRRFSRSLLIFSATGKATSFSTRLILNSDKIGFRFSALSSVVVTLFTKPLKPDLSFSNIASRFPFSCGKQSFKPASATVYSFSHLGKLLLSGVHGFFQFIQPFF